MVAPSPSGATKGENIRRGNGHGHYGKNRTKKRDMIEHQRDDIHLQCSVDNTRRFSINRSYRKRSGDGRDEKKLRHASNTVSKTQVKKRKNTETVFRLCVGGSQSWGIGRTSFFLRWARGAEHRRAATEWKTIVQRGISQV